MTRRSDTLDALTEGTRQLALWRFTIRDSRNQHIQEMLVGFGLHEPHKIS